MRRPLPSKKFIRKQTRIVILLFLVCVFYIWTTLPKDTPLPEATSSYAMLDGMKVHYLDYGEGKEGIVFIHGWTCDHSFWRFQVPDLIKTRLILLDLPGHGKSDKPKISYTQDLFAAGVNAVIEASGMERVVLVGHSMGYPVARQYIRNYPGKAEALVILEGAFYRIPKNLQKLTEWKKRVEQFADKFRGPESDRSRTEFMESLFAEQTSPELREEIKSKTLSTPQHVAISAMKGMNNPQIWKEDVFTLPTLALYAYRPNLPSDNGPYLKKLFPNLEYHEWDWVGHFPMMEKPKKFNRLLLNFLDELKDELEFGSWNSF